MAAGALPDEHGRRRRLRRVRAARRLLYAACFVKNWPLLQRISPALRDVDFATSDLPSVAAARDAYEALRTERDRVAAVHAAYDAYEYHTIHGEKLPRFRPKSLTPAARLPEPSRLFTPDTNDSIPTPPSQKALSSIVNHMAGGSSSSTLPTSSTAQRLTPRSLIARPHAYSLCLPVWRGHVA